MLSRFKPARLLMMDSTMLLIWRALQLKALVNRNFEQTTADAFLASFHDTSRSAQYA